ncbi:hypothetical protein [Paraburkholderia phenoliruptrix]|uniref:hypothetical protein n=1 Tax=Paraburkholderia phenoliruptrix TaxID=252970 RepID=UPI001427B023|nr:hypothetical protein [Paraburkholderia phenoliruptrix]
MEIAIFSSTPYERRYLDEANANGHHRLNFFHAATSRPRKRSRPPPSCVSGCPNSGCAS